MYIIYMDICIVLNSLVRVVTGQCCYNSKLPPSEAQGLFANLGFCSIGNRSAEYGWISSDHLRGLITEEDHVHLLAYKFIQHPQVISLIYALAVGRAYGLLLFEMWVQNPPFWAQTPPKRLIMICS